MTNFKVNTINQDGKKTSTTINGTIASYYRWVTATNEQKASKPSDFDTTDDYLFSVRVLTQSMLNDVVAFVINDIGYADKHSIEFEILKRIHLSK